MKGGKLLLKRNREKFTYIDLTKKLINPEFTIKNEV